MQAIHMYKTSSSCYVTGHTSYCTISIRKKYTTPSAHCHIWHFLANMYLRGSMLADRYLFTKKIYLQVSRYGSRIHVAFSNIFLRAVTTQPAIKNITLRNKHNGRERVGG